jgi:hypothetical protein
MKKLLYILCLGCSLIAVQSCKKDSDPEPQPVVGKWELERLRISGLVAPYASENGDSQINKNVISDVFTVRSDNTIAAGRFQQNGRITEYTGNWTFSNNELTVKDQNGNEDKYTLDTSTEPFKLITSATATSDSVTNPTTNKVEVVRYNIQFVYEKK